MSLAIKPVSSTSERFDVWFPIRLISESVSENMKVTVEVRFFNYNVMPNSLQQLILTNDLAATVDQHYECFNRLRWEQYLFAIAREHELTGVEPIIFKLVDVLLKGLT